MGLLDSVMGGIIGAVQLHKADKIHPQYTPYQTSQYAQNTLTNANNAYYGRMAGAQSLEQNIMANQANTQENVDRSATDGSQALAAKAAAQGQSNQAFHNLQIQEDQNKYNMLNNLNFANQGMTNEGDKIYQDKLMKYQMDAQAQAALRSSGMTNLYNSAKGMDEEAKWGANLIMGGGGGSGGSGGGGGKGMLGLMALL